MESDTANTMIKPSADQPRATTESLKRGDAPATLQYKTTSVKNANRFNVRKYGRALERP